MRFSKIVSLVSVLVWLVVGLGGVGASELDSKLQRRIRGVPSLEKIVVLFDKEAVLEKVPYEALVVVTVNGRFSKLSVEVAGGIEERVRAAIRHVLPKKRGMVVFQDVEGKTLRAVSF